MKAHACPLCGARMKRNGRTSAGRTRWRCTSCGASTVHRIDSAAKLLESFLGWLLTRERQADMPGGGRTFRRKTARFWEIWPMPPKVEAPRRVVYVDGIRLGRKAVVLIASDGENVLGWHLARTENSRAWSALMSRIAAPEVVVSDGGDGFAKALRGTWPGTRHQRCVFHAFSQVRRYTTTRPRTQAGAELYGLARALLSITTLKEADGWVRSLLAWSERWDAFLSETSVGEDGRPRLVHERLVKARRSLARLVNAGTLFTYLDPGLVRDGPLPATSNSIEGASTRSSGPCSGTIGGSPSSAGSRRSSGGATCTRPTRCRRRRSCASCPPTVPSPRSTGAWTSGEGWRAPSPSGATPSCGRSSTSRSPIGWTGTSGTHFLSYKPKSTHAQA